MFKFLKISSYVLVIIGAANLGLAGWLNFNLVEFLFGNSHVAVRVIYALVGLAAIISVTTVVKSCE